MTSWRAPTPTWSASWSTSPAAAPASSSAAAAGWPTRCPSPALYAEFAAAGERIAALYEAREYAAAIREIMELADRANRYVDQHKPWALAKDPARADEVRAIATQGVNLFRVLMSYLAPVLPRMAQAAGAVSRHAASTHWSDVAAPLLGAAARALSAARDPPRPAARWPR